MKTTANPRSAYRWFLELPTRWADNDVYGHVNNAAYYGFFDSAVNSYLLEKAELNITDGAQIGLVVETSCRYFSPLAFPAVLDIGLRAERVGNSSVTYGLGVFGKSEKIASAQAMFIHVYVDRKTRRPTPLCAPLRRAVMDIMMIREAEHKT